MKSKCIIILVDSSNESILLLLLLLLSWAHQEYNKCTTGREKVPKIMTIVEAEQDAVLAPCTRLCWGQLIGGIVAGRYLYKDVTFTITEGLRFLEP